VKRVARRAIKRTNNSPATNIGQSAQPPNFMKKIQIYFHNHNQSIIAGCAILGIIGSVIWFTYTDIKEKSGQITTLTSEREKLNSQLQAASTQVSDLTGTVSSLKPLYEASKQEVTDLQKQIADLQVDNKSQSEKLISLSQTNAQNDQQITHLNDDISYLYRRINVYQSGLSPAAQSNYREKIARVNDMLRLFRLEPWPISIDGWEIETSYIIMRKEKVKEPELQFRLLSFAAMAYTLYPGFQCHAMADLCSDLCKLMDMAVLTYNKDQTDAYKVALEQLTKADSNIGLKEEQIELAEITRTLRLMGEISDKSYLFLRGTADGTVQSWMRPLEDGYKFSEVERYLVNDDQCEGERIGCWHFSRSDAMTIPNPYTEVQLPNLRADYVADNVASLINSCPKTIPWSAKIKLLDGIEDKKIAESIRVPVRAVAGVIVIGKPIH
jgi:hypothetical protein